MVEDSDLDDVTDGELDTDVDQDGDGVNDTMLDNEVDGVGVELTVPDGHTDAEGDTVADSVIDIDSMGVGVADIDEVSPCDGLLLALIEEGSLPVGVTLGDTDAEDTVEAETGEAETEQLADCEGTTLGETLTDCDADAAIDCVAASDGVGDHERPVVGETDGDALVDAVGDATIDTDGEVVSVGVRERPDVGDIDAEVEVEGDIVHDPGDRDGDDDGVYIIDDDSVHEVENDPEELAGTEADAEVLALLMVERVAEDVGEATGGIDGEGGGSDIPFEPTMAATAGKTPPVAAAVADEAAVTLGPGGLRRASAENAPRRGDGCPFNAGKKIDEDKAIATDEPHVPFPSVQLMLKDTSCSETTAGRTEGTCRRRRTEKGNNERT